MALQYQGVSILAMFPALLLGTPPTDLPTCGNALPYCQHPSSIIRHSLLTFFVGIIEMLPILEDPCLIRLEGMLECYENHTQEGATNSHHELGVSVPELLGAIEIVHVYELHCFACPEPLTSAL